MAGSNANLSLHELPLLSTALAWDKVVDDQAAVSDLERTILQPFMMKCRWFGGKARTISQIALREAIPLQVGEQCHFLLVAEVQYAQGLPENYFLPVTFLPEHHPDEPDEYSSHSVVCRAQVRDVRGCVIDSSYDRRFRDFLFTNMEKGSSISDNGGGVLEFDAGVLVSPTAGAITSKILKADQSNTAIIYGDRYFFKFYRKVEKGINPDLEIVRFLTDRTTFRHAPRYGGSVQHHSRDGTIMVLGLLQERVENQGDAWVMTLEALTGYYDEVLALPRGTAFPPLVEQQSVSFDDAPAIMQELIGREFHDRVTKLGQRTAEMHQALTSSPADQAFAPESITPRYQQSLYDTLQQMVKDRFSLLAGSTAVFDDATSTLAAEVSSYAQPILNAVAEMYETQISTPATRIHGDYHLGQVLFTGADFVIIDFEGEPVLPFSERRRKSSPWKDVAGMMRSFHYAAYGRILLGDAYRDINADLLEQAAEQWQHYVSRFFLGAYMKHAGMGTDLSHENNILIRTFLLEKAIYELGYELNARPDWVKVPLKGIQYLVKRYLSEQRK